MPIVLTDRRTERVLEMGDSKIRYIVAGGDVALAEVRRSWHGVSAEDVVKTDTLERGVAAAVRLCARCVTGWENVLGEGDQPIPWPGEGKATGVPGRAAPDAKELRFREALLANLPWEVLSKLDAAVSPGWREATASGKGSPTA